MRKRVGLVLGTLLYSVQVFSAVEVEKPYSLKISESSPFYILKLGNDGVISCEIQPDDPQLVAKLRAVMFAGDSNPKKNLVVNIASGQCKAITIKAS